MAISLAAAQIGLSFCDTGLGSTGQGTRAFARSLLDSNLFVPIVLSVYLGSTAIRSKHWIVSLSLGFILVSMYLPFTYSMSWSGAEEKRVFSYALGDLRHAMIDCCFVLNAGLIILYCEHQRAKRLQGMFDLADRNGWRSNEEWSRDDAYDATRVR